MMVKRGLIFDIRRFSVNDGPGIRTTVFFKGCLLNCHWCHNPESRLPDIVTAERNISLEGKTFCETVGIGEWMTPDRVMTELEKDRQFYTSSGGGITFSGGEPLLQHAFLGEVLTACREKGLHTAVDTSGYCPEKLFKTIAPLTDLFLFDLKLMDDGEHQRYTGVSNEGIHRNLRFLFASSIPVIIRIPVIPGITDTDVNLQAIIRFLAPDRDRIQRVDLLPYHTVGRSKYHRLGKKELAPGLKQVSSDTIGRLSDLFRKQGLPV